MTFFWVCVGIAAIIVALAVGGWLLGITAAVFIAKCAIPICIIVLAILGYKIHKEKRQGKKSDE